MEVWNQQKREFFWTQRFVGILGQEKDVRAEYLGTDGGIILKRTLNKYVSIDLSHDMDS